MQKSFHIDCVLQANLPSLAACPDCGTTPDTMPADPDVMAEGMTAIAAEFQSIAADLVRPRPTSFSMVCGQRGRSLRCARCWRTQLAEVPADEREALFAKLGADDDGELDGEGASKRAQFLNLLATESAGASAHPTSSFPSPCAGRGCECGCGDSRTDGGSTLLGGGKAAAVASAVGLVQTRAYEAARPVRSRATSRGACHFPQAAG